jgi:polynucleotide 5'-kinase involved in rRNA processing
MSGAERFTATLEVLEEIDLKKATAAIRVTVFDEGEKFGELEIGRGSLMWRPRSGHSHRQMRWSRFDEIMEEFGRRTGG